VRVTRANMADSAEGDLPRHVAAHVFVTKP